MRQLWQCLNAKVLNETIYCSKGHALNPNSLKGAINLRRARRGEPLTFRVCQDCPDYDEMGPPLELEDRGWLQVLYPLIKEG